VNRGELFAQIYAEELLREIENDPDYCPDGVLVTVTRMLPALRRGSANLRGNPLRRTCRKLGIGFNRPAIQAYLREES
jgi:hypothetical protein